MFFYVMCTEDIPEFCNRVAQNLQKEPVVNIQLSKTCIHQITDVLQLVYEVNFVLYLMFNRASSPFMQMSNLLTSCCVKHIRGKSPQIDENGIRNLVNALSM